jgi:hypothetical protein
MGGGRRLVSATFGLFSGALVRLLSFTHFPNAATDAAIILRGECRKPRVSRPIVLVLLCILMVAGAHSLQCRKFVLVARGKSKKPGIGMISRAQPSAA